jgi:hypothetical protein
MKPLTERQARRCEDARGGRCRCRCGGAFHGSHRAQIAVDVKQAETPREWFEELPPTDPHKLTELTPAARAKRAKSAASAQARRRQIDLPL